MRLVEAEQVKSNWTPVQDLVIDSLSEQMDELKVMIIVECFETDCDLLIVRSVPNVICQCCFVQTFSKEYCGKTLLCHRLSQT